jgi:hypothetical protein
MDYERRFRLLGVISLGLFLYGCAGQPTVQNYVPRSGACCSKITDFNFVPMPLGQEMELSFTADLPTYAFDGRPQHFIALKIADGFTPTAIQVRTYLSTGFLPYATAVLPQFIYLGPDLRIVERQSTRGFQQAGGFWRQGVTGRADVTPIARYIVVVAGDGSEERPIYHSESGRAFSIPPAALGAFTLRLFGQTAGQK